MMTDQEIDAAVDLEPCPFCGGPAEYNNSDDGPLEWVACSQCGARGPSKNYNTHGFGAGETAWNQRSTAGNAPPRG